MPRRFGGTAGCNFVKPLTCISYTIDSWNGMFGARSLPQSKYGFVTTDLGMNRALSLVLTRFSSPKRYGYTG